MSVAPGPVQGPPAPTQDQKAPAKPKSTLPQSLQNLVATGSASPKMATLVNQATGDRQAVAVGSAQAQILFGQGYVLEQTPPTGGTQPTQPTAPAPTAPAAPDKLGQLQGEASRIRKEAFTSVYGYTPDEWQDLMPETQRQLRSQRVQDLAGQMGDVTAAIAQVKEETRTAKEDALNTLNAYLEYGVLQSLPEDQLSTLASQTGMSLDALKKIAVKTEERPKLEQVGSDLYEITWDEATKSYKSKLFLRGRTGGGGGGRSAPGDIKMAELGGIDYPASFVEYYKTYISPGAGTRMTPDPMAVQNEFTKWAQSKTAPKDTSTDTGDFRSDFDAGMSAVSSGAITGGEAYRRLVSAYPDRTETIRDAFGELGYDI